MVISLSLLQSRESPGRGGQRCEECGEVVPCWMMSDCCELLRGGRQNQQEEDFCVEANSEELSGAPAEVISGGRKGWRLW